MSGKSHSHLIRKAHSNFCIYKAPEGEAEYALDDVYYYGKEEKERTDVDLTHIMCLMCAFDYPLLYVPLTLPIDKSP